MAIIIVVPSRLISFSVSIMLLDFSGSRFPVGSSAKMILGLFNKDLAIDTLCCSTP